MLHEVPIFGVGSCKCINFFILKMLQINYLARMQMDDDGMMDLEAALAIMPEEIKGKLGPILTKCGTIGKITCVECTPCILYHEKN